MGVFRLTGSGPLIIFSIVMINPDLARLVKSARKFQGMTQVELQDLSGVSLSVIHKIESGRDDLSLSKVLAVMEALGIRLCCKSPLGEEIELNG